jgi:hypothetical protein
MIIININDVFEFSEEIKLNSYNLLPTKYISLHLRLGDKYLETDNITVDRNTNKIIFTDIDTIEYKYEILGVFDNMTRIWLWAWMSPEFMFNETDIVRKLLNYGLKINRTIVNRVTDDRLYLKTQLVNSRFLLEDNFFFINTFFNVMCMFYILIKFF